MKEITGNLWDYYQIPHTFLCITTNGVIKKDGTAVCGRGCAKEATQRIPAFAKDLGQYLVECGNVFGWLTEFIYVFPVKHNWWEKADLDLIRKSAILLKERALKDSYCKFILPRPGCGNGGRTWEEVKPLLEDLPDNVLVITF